MVSTGLTMVFQDDLGISRNIGHNVKEVHGFTMYLILTFIAAHIVGVYLAERSDQRGITSDMINGGE
jgi:Ni/Fe-hydrogenase 1 B-type cytochrome subunit